MAAEAAAEKEESQKVIDTLRHRVDELEQQLEADLVVPPPQPEEEPSQGEETAEVVEPSSPTPSNQAESTTETEQLLRRRVAALSRFSRFLGAMLDVDSTALSRYHHEHTHLSQADAAWEEDTRWTAPGLSSCGTFTGSQGLHDVAVQFCNPQAPPTIPRSDACVATDAVNGDESTISLHFAKLEKSERNGNGELSAMKTEPSAAEQATTEQPPDFVCLAHDADELRSVFAQEKVQVSAFRNAYEIMQKLVRENNIEGESQSGDPLAISSATKLPRQSLSLPGSKALYHRDSRINLRLATAAQGSAPTFMSAKATRRFELLEQEQKLRTLAALEAAGLLDADGSDEDTSSASSSSSSSSSSSFPSLRPCKRVLALRLFQRFYLLGQLAAKAFQDNRLVALRLHPVFWRRVAAPSPWWPPSANTPTSLQYFNNHQSSLAELIEVDRELALNLLKLRLIAERGAPLEDLAVSFVMPGTDVELIQGGQDVLVTSANVDFFIARCCQVALNEGIHVQVTAFRFGFSTFVPLRLLRAFLPEEMSTAVVGGDDSSRSSHWSIPELAAAIIPNHG
eukprot:GHVT01066481.1.p1 GENE.GHVT01066481.1~~GHVT01066481.1.p1  ORF type:complete len:568 (-),score=118.81 GHVT01066481.1:4363-6066(-)